MLKLLQIGAIFLTLPAWAQSVVFESSNLPIIVINTEGRTIVNEPKVKARMGIINNESGENHLTDAFTDYDGFIGIEYRGSSSQALFDKSRLASKPGTKQARTLTPPSSAFLRRKTGYSMGLTPTKR